ncbi:hypothetical protein OSB04_005355 [Centaurea solstitialis]|uniref:Uncharacterized protein n=1 Tax=Centaurea solstitialis TaxID=347529 RepID=A0AA38WPL1_9ASTR|nr:hypothetical protein OSB04_005355 [Centaurea solstitialis]
MLVKGHTLTKKRDPYGKEDSLQILHNLNEDELDGFEETWKVNADKHIPGWNDGFKSLENSGPNLYGHLPLGWNNDGGWDGWTLPWGTVGTMVTAGEPSSGGSSTSTGNVKKVRQVDIM